MGQLSRVRQARYATGEASFDAVVAVRVGGLLAGASAARSYGLWSGLDARIHVSVGHKATRLRTIKEPHFGERQDLVDRMRVPVVVHWLRDGATPEVGADCWRVSLPVALRQVVRWCDRETAVACLDTALAKGMSLAEVFTAEPAASRLVAGHARPGSESGIESLVRQRLNAVGLHPAQQVGIAGVGRVDIVLGGNLVIEVDGAEFHSDRAAFENDRRRDAALVGLGFRVIRLSYSRVINDWPECQRTIRAALSHSSFRTS
jgi:very-short-patch-repair endonuclease